MGQVCSRCLRTTRARQLLARAWHGVRRGFDSLVQAAYGITVTEQRTAGGSHVARLALAQTAAWLTGGTIPRDGGGDTPGYEAGEWLNERDSPLGRLRYALPPVAFDGGPRDWARPPGRWGTDAPRWS
ncbi:hypothetical protein [Streptomyces syringium]|uniref:hypothetical protein n=1 Tax=Streptomyces syringium TaxID=76729 RepID=UPI003AAA8A9C